MSQQFTKIYQMYYDKVYRLCLGYVNGEESLAKDLSQDVFIKVWEHLDTFQHKSSIELGFTESRSMCAFYSSEKIKRKQG